MDMYKEANILKVRFNTSLGVLTTEDLRDLPLTSNNRISLDGIAKGLNKELKLGEEESFVEKPSKENAILRLKFEIVKDVIKDRIEERDAAKNAADKKRERETLNGLISEKEHEALKKESVEDLKKRRDAL